MRSILTIIAITLLALPAVQAAQDEGTPHHRGHCRQHRLDKFDADKDGKLSTSERDAARAAYSAKLQTNHPKLFAKIDTNGDGVLSREECQAARKARREHHKAAE